MKLMLALEYVGGGAGVVIELSVDICVGDDVCASWCGVKYGFPRQGGQVRAVKMSRGVVDFLLPFFDGVSLPTPST
jgi:hypothetical protein